MSVDSLNDSPVAPSVPDETAGAASPIDHGVPCPGASGDAPDVRQGLAWTDRLLVGACTFAYLPLLAVQLRTTLRHSHYEFIPLYIGCCVGVAWWRWPRREAYQPLNGLATLLLSVSLPLLVLAIIAYSPWLGTVSAILTIGGLIVRFTGRAGVRCLFPVWCLLWFAIPLPFRFDIKLITSLQVLTSHSASVVLDLFGYKHLMSGNVLEFPGRKMFIEEACSGVQSLFTLMAFTALFVVSFRRPVIVGALLVISSLFWACLLNIARVTFAAIYGDSLGVDLTQGRGHELLGYVLYILAILMLASTDRLAMLLRRVLLGVGTFTVDLFRVLSKNVQTSEEVRHGVWTRLRGARANSDDAEPHSPPSPADVVERARRAPRFVACRWLTVCGVYFALGLVQVGAGVSPWHSSGHSMPAASVLFDAELLPARIGGWTLEKFHTETRNTFSDYGEHSAVWRYENGRFPVLCAIDYPFVGWHDLGACFRGEGWSVEERQLEHFRADDGNRDFSVVVNRLRKPSGEFGYLFYSEFDSSGTPLAPTSSAKTAVAGAMRRRFQKGLSTFGVDADVIQVQAFAPSDFPLSDDEKNALRRMFLQIRAVLLRKSISPENEHSR